jgi:hypothetical protein
MVFILRKKAPIKASILPPFFKGGEGGLYKHLIIPLNPPLEKGDFKRAFRKFDQNNCHTIYEA